MALHDIALHQLAARAPRHDGWTPGRKAQFLDHLASRGDVRAACARVGLSAEAAYRLRRRDPLFARGWAAALLLARESVAQVLATRAIDGVEEQVFYRGELIGTRRRYDARLLLAYIARLDQRADEEAAGADAGRFDELLACIAGEQPSDALAGADGVLPVGRERAAERAAHAAEQAVRYGEDAPAMPDEDDDACDDEDYFDEAKMAEREAQREAELEAFEDRCVEAHRSGLAAGEAQWDGWFERACGLVDALSGWPGAPPLRGLPGAPFAPALGASAGVGASRLQEPPPFTPWTLSTVSTSSLARALVGPAKGFVPPPLPLSPRRARLSW